MPLHSVTLARRPLMATAACLVFVPFACMSAAYAADEAATQSQPPQVAAPDAAPKVPLPYKLITKAAPAAEAASPATATAVAPAAPKPADVKPETAQTGETTNKVAAPAPQPAPVSTPAAAPIPAAPPKPAITLAIDIDLTRQRMSVTENGNPFGSWPISSGREGYRSPTGTFRPLWQSKMWYSKKYDNAPMPNAVFFSGGVAMHATQATGMLGRPASHGCIRQSPSDAATTYKLVTKHGYEHTKIVVHGTARDDEPRVARRDRGNEGPRVATRDPRIERQQGMRRVILVDGFGNRRIAEIPANDPRLLAYQARMSSMAGERRGSYRQDW